MSLTDYSLSFAIAGKISSDFARAFQTANKAVGGFGSKIEELQKQAKTASAVLIGNDIDVCACPTSTGFVF